MFSARSIPASVLASLFALLALFAAIASGAEAAPWRPFAPDSVWNLPLRSDVPISPKSATYVNWLNGQVAGGKTWINTSHCAMPDIRVGPNVAPVKVALRSESYQDTGLLKAWANVPIPSNASAAECEDHNIAITQLQPDGEMKEWELWNAERLSDGSWIAGWGGATNDVGDDRGIASPLAFSTSAAGGKTSRLSTRFWNVTATSVSMIAGVITYDELKAGRIEHALAVAIPNAAKGRWMWPAQRSDGSLQGQDALPEGARLRINPNLDLSKIPMTPLVRMMAEAVQKYGMIVRDRSGSTTTFYTEELNSAQSDLVGSLLEGQYANNALRAFPWGELEVLDAPECTVGTECSVTNQAKINVNTAAPQVGSPVLLDTTNSTLNYPRQQVSWDFDGDGTFEYDAGTAVMAQFTPQAAGNQTVAVRIKTTDGTTVEGHVSIDVQPAGTTPEPPEEPSPPTGPAPEQPMGEPGPEQPTSPGAATGVPPQARLVLPAGISEGDRSDASPACGPPSILTLKRAPRTRSAGIVTLRGSVKKQPGVSRCVVSVYRRSTSDWKRVGTARNITSTRFVWRARLRTTGVIRLESHPFADGESHSSWSAPIAL